MLRPARHILKPARAGPILILRPGRRGNEAAPPAASDGLTRLQRSRVCHRPGPVGGVGIFPANRQPLSGAVSASGSSMTHSFLFSGNPQQELTNIQAKLGPFLQSAGWRAVTRGP